VVKIFLIVVIAMSMARCARIDPCGTFPMQGNNSSLPQSFTSAEGRFKINLPPTIPKSETDNAKGYNDTSFKWFILNRGEFEVSYFDSANILEASETSEPLLNKFRDIARAKGPGELEVDAEIRLAGHPGRELRIRNKHSLQIQRIYLVNKRLYLVNAFVPDELNCGLDDVVKTLDSFALIDETAAARTLLPGD
jgi:hypothetical protein